MTVAAIPAIKTYDENGASTVFTVPFQFIAREDLVVERFDPAGVRSLLVLGTDYSVAGGGGAASIATGSITTMIAKPIGWTIRISRATPRTQPANYTPGDTFPAESHERALDREMLCIQEVGDQAAYIFARALRTPEPIPVLPGAAARANMLEGWDPAGLPLLVDRAMVQGNPGGNVMAIGLLTNASALVIPVGTDLVQTSGYNAIGKGHARYAADPAVNAAFVALHPGWSFVSANGRGFRLAEDMPSFLMFGAVADFNGVAGTDNYPAWQRAADFLNWSRQGRGFAGYYQLCPPLHIPLGWYYSSDTFDLDFGSVWLSGDKAGHPYGGGATLISFAAGKTGIRVHTYNTSENTAIADRPAAQGSVIEGIHCSAVGDHAGRDADGFRVRGVCTIRDCTATAFSRDGLHIEATMGGGGAVEGNANCTQVYNFQAANNGRDGIFVDGADANAMTIVGFNCLGNGRYGWNDDSFLGNTVVGYHCEGNGTAAAAYNVARGANGGQCHYAGNRYAVVLGQEVAAGATVPGTNAAIWQFVGAGGAAAVYPTWAGGMTWGEGGAWKCTDNNAGSVIVGGYTEPGQPPAKAGGRQLILVGNNFAGIQGGDAISSNIGSGIFSRRYATIAQVSDGPINVAIGGGSEGTQTFLEITAPDHTLTWRLKRTAKDIVFDYANLTPAFGITGPATTQQFGTGVAQPYMFNPYTVVLGAGAAGRKVTTAAAAPAAGAHAQGEIVFNNAPAAGGKVGWVCTAAGTPGTWKLFGAIDP